MNNPNIRNVDVGQETEGGPFLYRGGNRPAVPVPGLKGGSDGAIPVSNFPPTSNSVLTGADEVPNSFTPDKE
jgi:hypothetical protein